MESVIEKVGTTLQEMEDMGIDISCAEFALGHAESRPAFIYLFRNGPVKIK